MRNTPRFEIQPAVEGRRLTVFVVLRNGKSEALEFLEALEAERPGEYALLIQNLMHIADDFPHVRESRLRKLKDGQFEDLWEVKRGQHRLYGFVAPGGLYLYRYDLKTKAKPNRAILKSVADCRREWREHYD